ncbi:MAG TPA: hypothetical protein VNX65_03515 [Patescibacteria group bacterium]|jgi:hypothetical protein|nr:hypothetical protein [Patescibacteria group bacterium]
MRNKLTITAAAITALVTMTSYAAPAFAHNNQNNDDQDDKPFVLNTKQVDLAPTTDPTAIGQTYALTEDVFDKGGKMVGHDGVSCTATRIITTGSEFICMGGLRLDGRGELEVQGLFTKGEKHIVAAITGGTGEFKSAHGQVTIDVISDTERSIKVELDD